MTTGSGSFRRYVIAAMLNGMEVGTEFDRTQWPAHVTLVSNFTTEAPIFTHALDHLGLEAAEVAMVGDRSRPDGGAVELGIVTLLLPPLRSSDDERLDAVIKLAL